METKIALNLTSITYSDSNDRRFFAPLQLSSFFSFWPHKFELFVHFGRCNCLRMTDRASYYPKCSDPPWKAGWNSFHLDAEIVCHTKHENLHLIELQALINKSFWSKLNINKLTTVPIMKYWASQKNLFAVLFGKIKAILPNNVSGLAIFWIFKRIEAGY